MDAVGGVLVGALLAWLVMTVFGKAKTQPATPAPDHSLARWAVTYADTRGAVTARTVRVLETRPDQQRLVVWCELRGDERTLLWSGLRSVADASTGETIDVRAWSAAVASRKRAA
jgi:hypothetical protein